MKVDITECEDTTIEATSQYPSPDGEGAIATIGRFRSIATKSPWSADS